MSSTPWIPSEERRKEYGTRVIDRLARALNGTTSGDLIAGTRFYVRSITIPRSSFTYD